MGAETTQDDVMIMVDSYAGICMISCRNEDYERNALFVLAKPE